MRNRPFATALLAGAMLCTSAVFGAQATVVSGSSSAFDETVNLTVGVPLSIVSVTSGPLASGAGTAPAPYVFGPTSVASASVGVGAPNNILSTAVLTVNGSSNVDGTGGIRSAQADATVNSLSVLLNLLTATTVQSMASVTGDAGSLARAGQTTIEGLTFGGLINVNLMPAPNTMLINAAGLSIMLNEQIMGGDGISAASLTVNAIHIHFSDFIAATGIVNGDIIISHSEAALAAIPGGTEPGAQVPEPGTLVLFSNALLGLGLMRRRNA